MSSNNNHSISLRNYEEWFVLYMDNELSAEQKKEVENFLLLHPHLQEELDLLLGTKLPEEDLYFSGKKELLAASMKLNTVEEDLLLYIDNELPAADKGRVEERILSDKDFRLQYELLQKTKPDASERILYPDKEELYRRVERRIFAPAWMRAAAVLLLLAGGYFLVINQDADTAVPDNLAVVEKPTETNSQTASPTAAPKSTVPSEQNAIAKTPENKKEKGPTAQKLRIPVNEAKPAPADAVVQQTERVAIQQQAAIRIGLEKLSIQTDPAVNNSVANLPVTSAHPVTLNITEDPMEPAVTEGDDKPNHRTPAKGFLRKVSRFIERRTGIGTVNADNELLVGAVALKLN